MNRRLAKVSEPFTILIFLGVSVYSLACYTTCKRCDGPSTKNCLECYSGKFHDDRQGTCSDCQEKCSACSGPLSTECSGCNSGYFLTGESCATTCASHFYKNYVDKTCEVCDASCLECSGFGAERCKSCNVQSFQVGSQCFDCPPGCSSCTEINHCSDCLDTAFYYDKDDLCYVACP